MNKKLDLQGALQVGVTDDILRPMLAAWIEANGLARLYQMGPQFMDAEKAIIAALRGEREPSVLEQLDSATRTPSVARSESVEWTVCSTSNPPNYIAVLLANGEIISTGYFDGRDYFMDVNSDHDPRINPTHWMPLPKRPA